LRDRCIDCNDTLANDNGRLKIPFSPKGRKSDGRSRRHPCAGRLERGTECPQQLGRAANRTPQHLRRARHCASRLAV